MVRAGTHLMIATSVNNSPAKWFMIDSGGFSNMIDTESAHDFTGVHRDDRTSVQGVQGRVDQVSRADRVTLIFGGFKHAINLEKVSDSMGLQVTGVLGMPVLSQLKLTIDYPDGAMKFER